MLTILAGPGTGSHPGLELFHSQPSSPVQPQTEFQEQYTPDTMLELAAAGGVQDQACKDAQASLQSSNTSLAIVTHDLNDRWVNIHCW